MSLPPVRCFTCGKVIASKWNQYLVLLQQQDFTEGEVLTKLGFNRICCRRMLLTHCDKMDQLLTYSVLERRAHEIGKTSSISASEQKK